MGYQVVNDVLARPGARLRASFSGVVKIAMAAGTLTLISGTPCEVQAVQVTQNPTEAVSPAAPAPSGSNIGKSTGDRSTAPSATGNTTEDEIKGLPWIKQQPGSNYTLQLMAAASPKPLLAFTHKESLAGPLAMAAFRRDDKVLHLLLQGSYTSLDEAETAATQLEQMTRERPWVRKFSSLPELYDSNSPPQQNHKPVKLPPITVTGAAWLWSRNPVRHTIQLKGGRHAEPLRASVERYRPAGPIAIIHVKRQGKPWYLLLIGDYASEEEAAEAIKTLPPEMSKGGAWPRRFASLQDQMVSDNH